MGGIATLGDFFIYHMLSVVVGINPIISNTFSFSIGLVINFYLSIKWVFNRAQCDLKKEFMLFSAVGVMGLLFCNLILFALINLGTLHLLTGLEGDIIDSLAKVIATIIVLFWNFFARKKVIQFGERER
ncbi:MAG: GtrA family protein [Clostridiaceae bacterium]|nr:GtrA family protein [Clostridiaceae bacterium]